MLLSRMSVKVRREEVMIVMIVMTTTWLQRLSWTSTTGRRWWTRKRAEENQLLSSGRERHPTVNINHCHMQTETPNSRCSIISSFQVHLVTSLAPYPDNRGPTPAWPCVYEYEDLCQHKVYIIHLKIHSQPSDIQNGSKTWWRFNKITNWIIDRTRSLPALRQTNLIKYFTLLW